MSIEARTEPAAEHVVEHYLKYWTKAPPSQVGIRVAKLLDAWHGLHHFESASMHKVDWCNPLFIELKISRCTSVGQLSTYDFDALTTLVFLAHDHCIRVDVQPCNGTHLKLMFHPRASRQGDMSRRHPTVEQALDRWRKSYPVDALSFAAEDPT